MKALLQLNASLYSREGQSSRLADRFVAGWRAANRTGIVVERDLARDPVPHLDAKRFAAFATQAGTRTQEQQGIVDYSDALIAELQKADVIVLGLPFYNFGVPSTLKAYFDHVARAGVTFKYTEGGSVGLLGGKKVYVFATRGGLYAGTPADTQTPYIRQFLGLLGIEDIEFVYAEGLAISTASKEAAVAGAQTQIERLTQCEWRAAA